MIAYNFYWIVLWTFRRQLPNLMMGQEARSIAVDGNPEIIDGCLGTGSRFESPAATLGALRHYVMGARRVSMSGPISATKIEPSGARARPCPTVPNVRQRPTNSPEAENRDNRGV